MTRKKTDRLYGLGDDLLLDHERPDQVVKRELERAVTRVGEPVEATAERMTWPMRVCEYRRMTLPTAESCAGSSLYNLLGRLDEDFAGPSDAPTSPTPAMVAAEKAFHAAVLAEYVPWMVEPTGRVIEYTREQAVALVKRGRELPEAPKETASDTEDRSEAR